MKEKKNKHIKAVQKEIERLANQGFKGKFTISFDRDGVPTYTEKNSKMAVSELFTNANREE